MKNIRRIGIIGYGQIGSYVVKRLQERKDIVVAFVHDQDQSRLDDLPGEIILEDLSRFEQREVDLVCELAHPEVSTKWGRRILESVDYLMLSVTALASEALYKTLTDTALAARTKLFIAHGGVMGLDAIIDGREMWEDVTMEMRKHPANLDFTVSGMNPDIQEETVLYDGATRDLCSLFPRNVNTHATLALAGIGFDRTHSVLIADPRTSSAALSVTAEGGGVDLRLSRQEKITGVSGASTPWSVYKSIVNVGDENPGMHFC